MSNVDTSADAVDQLAAAHDERSGVLYLAGKGGPAELHAETAATLRALQAERDALRARVEAAERIASENENIARAVYAAHDTALATARREGDAGMREKAARIVDSTPTTDQRAAHEVMRRIRALPLPGESA